MKAFPEYFYNFLHHYVASLSDVHIGPDCSSYHVFLPSATTPLFADADARVEQMYVDFHQISQMLFPANYQSDSETMNYSNSLLPRTVDIPQYPSHITDKSNSKAECSACIILTSILTSALRNCLYPSSKLHTIDMLLVLGLQMDDDYRLDRIVPYLVSILNDSHSLVRINALATLTQLVQNFSFRFK